MRSDCGQPAAEVCLYAKANLLRFEFVNDPLRMRIGDWGLLLLLSILWGGSFFFAKVIVEQVPPLTLVLVRFSVAAFALWAYVRACRLPIPTSLGIWAAFAGMGALNNLVPAALITWGQMAIASGLAAILIATTPVFSILAAHWLTNDEKMSANKSIGVGLGLVGVVVLVGVDFLGGLDGSILAVAACLAAAVSYGFANVFGRRFKRLGIAPAVGAFGQITSTAVMMIPLALTFESPWRIPVPTADAWLAMAGLSLLSTALGYVIFFRILGSAGGTNVSLVTLLIPVSAILLGRFILGERLLDWQYVGMALIAAGLLAIDGRVWPTARIRKAKPRDG